MRERRPQDTPDLRIVTPLCGNGDGRSVSLVSLSSNWGWRPGDCRNGDPCSVASLVDLIELDGLDVFQKQECDVHLVLDEVV